MRQFKHLSTEERYRIYDMKNLGMSITQIGESIGRSKSTISMELKRNKTKNKYLPMFAQQAYEARQKNSYNYKIDRDPDLRSYIFDRMRLDKWSPDVIAGKLRLDNILIATETIYNWIYNSPWALSHGVYKYLPTKRIKRLPRVARKKRSIIEDRVSIHERDNIANEKEELGHLEMDLTFHTGNRSRNIGVAVDKTSQKLFLTINQNKSSKVVISALKKKLKALPVALRKTITMDNGKEFMGHSEFKKLGFATYFCDPYSPNQKPLVEKINSMIHRVLPKNINIKYVTKKTIRMVENILNNMPRRILGFRTPNEVWNEKMQLCSILN